MKFNKIFFPSAKAKKAPPPAPKTKPKEEVFVSGSGKPVFKVKLQDSEVVAMSAARFEVVVKGNLSI